MTCIHIKEDYTMSSKNRTPGEQPPETSTAVAEPSAPDAGGTLLKFHCLWSGFFGQHGLGDRPKNRDRRR